MWNVPLTQLLQKTELLFNTVLHKLDISPACDFAPIHLHLVQLTHLTLYYVYLSPQSVTMVADQLLLLSE